MADLREVEVLVVAGGGAGSHDIGGGGGGGGVIHEASYTLTPGESVIVEVGAGGRRPTSAENQGAGTETKQEIGLPKVFSEAGTFFIDVEPGTYTIKAWGAGGGGAAGGTNGFGCGAGGGSVVKTGINVKTKERWQIYVGQGGASASGDAAGGTAEAGIGGAGYGKGGDGAGGGTVWAGGGGGGSTAVIGPSINGVLVAAGGGGAGSNGSLAGYATGGGVSIGQGGAAGTPNGQPGASAINGGGGGGGSNGIINAVAVTANTGPDRLIQLGTGTSSNKGMTATLGLNPKFFPTNLDGSFQTAAFVGHMTYGNNDNTDNNDWTILNAFDGSHDSRAWISPREADNYAGPYYGEWTFPSAITVTKIFVMPRDLGDGFPNQVEVYVDNVLKTTATTTINITAGQSGHGLNYTGRAFAIDVNQAGRVVKLVFTEGSKSFSNEVGVYIGEIELWGFTTGSPLNSVPADQTGVGGQGGSNEALNGINYNGANGGSDVQLTIPGNVSDINYTAPAGQGGTLGGNGVSGRVVIIQTQIGGGDPTQSHTNGNGGNSRFGALVALGGGGGAGSLSPNAAGGGGSGGGAGSGRIEGSGTVGQGFAGAKTDNGIGGGGGGAAAAGNTNGSGGIGLASYITEELEFFGGGGSGCDINNSVMSSVVGGGGGAEDRNGKPNTGGGGAASYGSIGTAGDGGSGIVIVRYPLPVRAQGGEIFEKNGYAIHRFIQIGVQRFLPDLTPTLDIPASRTDLLPASRSSGSVSSLSTGGLNSLSTLMALNSVSAPVTSSNLGEGCEGPTALSEYYAGGGIVRDGTIGYPEDVRTEIPQSGTIAIKNFYGSMTGYYYIMGVDLATNANINTPQNNTQIRFDVKSIREVEKLYYTIENPTCYNMDSFVAQFRVGYSADVYRTQALKIYPLYVSNDRYDLPDGATRYGLYRYPDASGLAYWTTTTLQANIDPQSGAFYKIFFSAASAAPGERELTPNKEFNPLTTGCGFSDDGSYIAPIPIPTPTPIPVPVGPTPVPVFLPVPIPTPTPPPPPLTPYTISILPNPGIFNACSPAQIQVRNGPPGAAFGILKRGPIGSYANGTGLETATGLALNAAGAWNDTTNIFTQGSNGYSYTFTFNPPEGTEIVGGNQKIYNFVVNPPENFELLSLSGSYKTGELISVGIVAPIGATINYDGPTQGQHLTTTSASTIYLIGANSKTLPVGTYTWNFSIAGKENCYQPLSFTATITTATIPVPVVPTYQLKSNVALVNEGGAFLITLDTTNLVNGTKVPFTISGITSSDISGAPLTGEFTINNNYGSATFTANADLVTEGAEIFAITLSRVTPTVSTTVVINDTSIATPTPVTEVVNWTTVCPNSYNGYDNVILPGITGVVTNGTANVTASSSATGGVWGNNTYGYASSSNWQKAVIHAGLLSNGQTGIIRFQSLGSKNNFPGSPGNNITSSSYTGDRCAVQISLVSITSGGGGSTPGTPGGTPGTPGGTPGTPGGTPGTPGTPGGTPGTPGGTPGTPGTPGGGGGDCAPYGNPNEKKKDVNNQSIPCGQGARIVKASAEPSRKYINWEFSGVVNKYEIKLFVAGVLKETIATGIRGPGEEELNGPEDMNVAPYLRNSQYVGKRCEFQIVLYGNGKDYEIADFTINNFADKTSFTRCDCTVPPWSPSITGTLG